MTEANEYAQLIQVGKGLISLTGYLNFLCLKCDTEEIERLIEELSFQVNITIGKRETQDISRAPLSRRQGFIIECC